MKFKHLIIFLLFFLTSCESYHSNSKKINNKIEKKYKNSGFTLIYNENLNLKKLDNRSLSIFHKNLKKNSSVKLTNPSNNKSLIATVKSKDNFSNFYNSVISTRIAETLELNLDEPFIEITLISKDSTFIAKKTKTFEEEKEVAEKAPVDGIKISNLNNNSSNKNKNKKNKKTKFSYSIKVADFYYQKTAKLMIDRIKNETKLNKLSIVKMSKTNYRVLIGPFNDINALKKSYEEMNSLYFENLEIIKNV
tara:strand:+ start:744 stop:1493 length:750 start_codon:yes stop_codon:yes gene_type:complete